MRRHGAVLATKTSNRPCLEHERARESERAREGERERGREGERERERETCTDNKVSTHRKKSLLSVVLVNMSVLELGALSS
jgi:hypothetical protein